MNIDYTLQALYSVYPQSLNKITKIFNEIPI